ncbi:hypothetical protein F0562_004214 [Nyssa sinensis]|uniref:non-specific serine/threonine protein kinase n=1 Tax=Nyssa sinensis TaxID=561372 RepID=A0A5J5BXI0_9ASTE|nr:hypothetical protein F0562_004214 [Nyssa sinensis]
MLHQLSPPFHLLHLSFTAIFLISIILPAALPAADERYIKCGNSFKCGDMQNLSYPFWGDPQPFYCGLPEFKLECQSGFPVIQIFSERFRVLKINHEDHILRLARLDLNNSTCPSRFMNTTISYLFSYRPNFGNLTMFYGCSSVSPALSSNKFSCHKNDTSIETGYFTIGSIPSNANFGNCNVSITVPVLQTAVKDLEDNITSLNQVLDDGFEVNWVIDQTACSECAASAGRCGYNSSYYEPICFCPDHPYLMRCPVPSDTIDHGSKSDIGNQILIAASMFGVCSILVIAVVVCYSKRKTILNTSIGCWKKKTNIQNVEAFLEKCGSLAPKSYSYSDVKKITCSFKDKLGEGGYGSVYKGKLRDGRLVAVKVLNKSKGNGEEFVNEVASISRTSHVNIVTLLGFCFEGSKRALIYEFMPNGSLEKYIYDENQFKKIPSLGWERIYQIAIGIAQGLEYLHRGCNTQILHLDIKPQNILLDQDFCPKISDFGLAKLCPRKESTMSMLGARGTVGYVAPEVFSRNFGVVSHKSDVYSYGMMILEMVGGRKNIDTRFGCTSETYFPHWIYKRLELEEDLKLQWNMNKAEEEVARKMILVGLWCIQTDPGNRPSMNRVVDMLEGNQEALQIPPKPFPSSPVRTPAGRPRNILSQYVPR